MNPLYKQIIQFFQNAPFKPYTVNDIASSIGKDEAQVQNALIQLTQYGYTYPSNNYWFPTKYALEYSQSKVQKQNWKPSTDYEIHRKKFKSMTPETRENSYEDFLKVVMDYYPSFTSTHPEYKKLFEWLGRNKLHMKEFIKDAAAILMHMDISHPTIAYPKEKYALPKDLISIEHAMSESLNRLIANVQERRRDVLTQEEYYKSYSKVEQLASKIQDKFIKEVISKQVKGSVIPQAFLESFIKADLEKAVTDKKHSDLFIDMVQSKLSTEKVDPLKYEVFFTNTPIDKIVLVLRKSLEKGPAFTNKYKSTEPDGSKKVMVFTKVFCESDFSGMNLKGISFTIPGFTLTGTRFQNTNFEKSEWSELSINNCDFSGAKITNSAFKPAIFVDNIIEKTDFEGSSLNKKIDWEQNPGTPLNLFVKDADYAQEKLPEILKSRNLRFSSIPLGEEDLESAKTVAITIKKFLDSKDIFASQNLRLIRFSALSQNIVSQLRAWLENEEAVPSFSFKGSMSDWLIEKNRTGELKSAGFSNKDINTLFGRSRNFQSQEQSELSPEQKSKHEREAKINSFLTQYQGKETIPANALVSLLPTTEGTLYKWFSSFRKDLTYIDLQKIYYALVSSLKDYHVNPYVNKTTKRFLAFPHSSYMHDLHSKKGESGVAGKGTQFGVALRPNFDLMPQDVAEDAWNVVQHGSRHLTESIAFARITPANYIITSMKGKPQKKYAWYISEMQSDPYQKAFDDEFTFYEKMHKGEEPKGDKEALKAEINEKFNSEDHATRKSRYLNNLAAYEATREFRTYFKHWPENLLNTIITLAGENGVDEIWMPKGADVSKNVGSGTNWTYNYDRPAKTFGGKLKDLGTKIKLDPGSSYDGKTSEVYVIEIPKNEGLKLGWANVEENYSEDLKEVVGKTIVYLIGIGLNWRVIKADVDSEGSVAVSNTMVMGKFNSFKEAKEFAQGLLEDAIYFRSSAERDHLEFLEKTSSLKLNWEPSLSLQNPDDPQWGELKEKVQHHFTYVINHFKNNHPNITQYLTDNQLAQWAYRTFYDEYNIPPLLRQDPDFVQKVKDIVENELGYKLLGNPYIEWVYWVGKALEDVRWYITNQRQISPDMNASDQELARDWYKLWLEEHQVPQDMVRSPWFPLFEQTVQKALQDKGYGDILGTEYQLPQTPEDRINSILNPQDNDEGEKEFVDPAGQPEEPSEESLKFEDFYKEEEEAEIREEMIDNYLDQLHEALSEGDNEKAQQIKQKIDELQALGALKFSVFNKYGDEYEKNIKTAQDIEGQENQDDQEHNQETSESSEKTELDIYYPEVEDIINAHDWVIKHHGGRAGLPPGGQEKLEAAIGRMQSAFGGREFYPSLFEKTAVLMHSIVSTHPFADGNKRTAYMAGVLFLQYNDFTMEDSEDLAEIIIKVADSQAGYDHLFEWVAKNAKHLIEKHAPSLKKLTDLKLDWAIIEEEETEPLDPNIVLVQLQNELDEEIQSGQPGIDDSQYYEYVYPLTKRQMNFIEDSLLPYNRADLVTEYLWFYVAQRNYMGEEIFDLIGVGKDFNVETIEPSFIGSLSEIIDMERWARNASLDLNWAELPEETFMDPLDFIGFFFYMYSYDIIEEYDAEEHHTKNHYEVRFSESMPNVEFFVIPRWERIESSEQRVGRRARGIQRFLNTEWKRYISDQKAFFERWEEKAERWEDELEDEGNLNLNWADIKETVDFEEFKRRWKPGQVWESSSMDREFHPYLHIGETSKFVHINDKGIIISDSTWADSPTIPGVDLDGRKCHIYDYHCPLTLISEGMKLDWAQAIKAPSSKHFNFEESTWFDETEVGNMNTEYFKKLVPDQGEAETVYGELLREINNIYYDRYNNGLCNAPHGINTIIKFKDELKENYLEDPSDYDKFIRALARHRNNAYCPDEWEGDGPMETMLYAILLLIRDNVQ